ncbi:MAG: hypothetical protein JO219_13075 [Candidatus Eremiobacteraeota bacterium]|nr:hypothetical protein [Candidatus Eremiobacteraeota bacterium]MBV8365399.1 hypothetical protein [Candidatus Eremiobacteraeota bacterium]
MKGTVLSCNRYGCVVRLADGRIGNLPSSDPQFAQLKRALSRSQRPRMDFSVAERDGWLLLTTAAESAEPTRAERAAPVERIRASDASLDEKIIEYLRQTEDWDPHNGLAARVQDAKEARAARITQPRKKR